MTTEAHDVCGYNIQWSGVSDAAGAIALLRLAQKYGDAVLDEKLVDYLPPGPRTPVAGSCSALVSRLGHSYVTRSANPRSGLGVTAGDSRHRPPPR